MRSEGVKSEGVRSEGVKSEGVRSEVVTSEGEVFKRGNDRGNGFKSL